MMRSLLTSFTLFISIHVVCAQDKLVIDDRTGMLTSELEGVIGQKLQEEQITLSNMVDFTKRCDYYFSVLQKSDDDLVIKLSDCNDAALGEKNLGNRIISAPLSEQGIMISYAIMDIVSNPGKYLVAAPAENLAASFTTATAPRKDSAIANEHNTRYFFAPSSYNLKKGELYYNTVYFLIHDIQYGFSDYFSMGMGTTIIGLPLYFTPKLSLPVGKKSALAVGDLLMLGTWGSDFLGNLVYGTFSNGGRDGNFTVGAGYLSINENDLTGRTSSLVSNLSGMTRISPYMFLLTENYVMSANFYRNAYFQDSYEEFVQRNTFWYGILGIRIISKNRDFISWQMGLTYVVNFPGDIPPQYNSWNTDAPTSARLIAFPTVSFTIKFSGQ